jgi:hypothetical protein
MRALSRCWACRRGFAAESVIMAKISYAGYRFPPVIIQQAVWLYARFTLSFRDVEDLLAERGIMVSYEVARFILGFSADVGKMAFTIEVHNTELMAKVRFDAPTGSGIFQASFVLNCDKPQQPIEIRLRNEEGAIEGRIALAWIEFMLQSE